MVQILGISVDDKLFEFLKGKRTNKIKNMKIILEEDILSKLFSEKKYEIVISSYDRKKRILYIISDIPLKCLENTIKATYYNINFSGDVICIEHKTYNELLNYYTKNKLYLLDKNSGGIFDNIPLYGINDKDNICRSTAFSLIEKCGDEEFYQIIHTMDYNNLIFKLGNNELNRLSLENKDLMLVTTKSLFDTKYFWK